MRSLHVKSYAKRRKGFRWTPMGLLVSMGVATQGCLSPTPIPSSEIRVLVDAPPISLNPRSSLDATGQRLNSLIFRALTRLNADLQPEPDLATEWRILEKGKVWRFRIAPGLQDHTGQPITAQTIQSCLENYRLGKPISPLRASFPSWIGSRVEGDEVILTLDQPDPYFPRNLSVIRYFRTEKTEPCSEPVPGKPVIGSGRYVPTPAILGGQIPDEELLLVNRDGGPSLRFVFVPDDNTRTLKILRGDVEAAFNSLPAPKLRWILEKSADRFRAIHRDGIKVSYLAFNMRDPLLSKVAVRKAIALALDREQIVATKLRSYVTPAGSLLSPLLSENRQVRIPFDPRESERLLDEAGFPRDPATGRRLQLRYKTTPAREGFETALMFQEMLKKVGIDLVIDSVEPAVFFSSIRKGHYQLFSSRWLGVADGSILYHTLRSGQSGNRWGYLDPEIDKLLDAAHGELDETRRKALLATIQEKASVDLPFLPLWFWNNTLLLSNRVQDVRSEDLSLSGGYDTLTRLRLKK